MFAAGNFICNFEVAASEYLEDLSPEKLFKLNVFFCAGKKRLPVANFIVNSVFNHLLEDSFLVSVFSHEVLMTFVRGDDKIDQDTDFVSETLVIFLVSFQDDFVKLGL